VIIIFVYFILIALDYNAYYMYFCINTVFLYKYYILAVQIHQPCEIKKDTQSTLAHALRVIYVPMAHGLVHRRYVNYP
jgi:hypothetical protein